MATGAHTAHINQGNLGTLKCVDCHKSTVLNNNTTVIYANNLHVNGSKNVSMKLFNTYTGAYTASLTCRNVYCHSTGQSIPVVSTTPVWNSGALNCDGCHGIEGTTLVAGAPEYANLSSVNRNTFNGHQVSGHVSATTDCVKCHNQTVDATSAILSTGLHINGARNVSFQLGGSYDTVNKRCSNTDIGCHGTTVMRWGGSGSCVDCHQVTTSDVDDYTYNNGTKAVINFYDYTSVGHGKKSTYRYTGRAGANLGCLDCHTASAAHGLTTNPFRLLNADTNALCLSCHTAGISNHDLAHVGQGTWSWTPKCVDCHDPHGDSGGVTAAEKNAAMVQSKVAYTGSDTYGVPSTTSGLPG
jgi:predicted CxxxxCH...CXXCH cytochrome family protein